MWCGMLLFTDEMRKGKFFGSSIVSYVFTPKLTMHLNKDEEPNERQKKERPNYPKKKDQMQIKLPKYEAMRVYQVGRGNAQGNMYVW